ncbi:MAG: polymer-forming cytoskeletal protein [Spirochaetales bacterium]
MAVSYYNVEQNQVHTKLGTDTVLKGTLRFSHSVRIQGQFEGTIDSSGFLYIAEGAVVKAEIKAKTIIVGGVVHGNLEAAERVEMLSTGKIYGNVRTAKLKIADGVTFEGKCEMIKRSDRIDIFSLPIQELKKSIQNV